MIRRKFLLPCVLLAACKNASGIDCKNRDPHNCDFLVAEYAYKRRKVGRPRNFNISELYQ
jgi:hypothetical protein